MSALAFSWVLRHSRSEGLDRLVLLLIADGLGAPTTTAELARAANCGPRQVNNAIAKLEAMGELVVERRRGDVVRFELGTPAARALPAAPKPTPATPRIVDAARELVGELWPQLHPPIAHKGRGFVIACERVTELLEAGHTAAQIRRVLPSVTVWSQRALELAFRHGDVLQDDYLAAWRQSTVD